MKRTVDGDMLLQDIVEVLSQCDSDYIVEIANMILCAKVTRHEDNDDLFDVCYED
jgi:hypothetical protein